MDALTGDRFGRRLLQGSAPFMVWALHVFGAYVLVAVACCTSLAATPWFGLSAVRVLLLAASLLALAVIALLLVRGLRAPRSLLRSAATGSAVLAFIGVVWTTLPMLALPLCACS